MKKIVLLLLLTCVLSACQVGNFPEKRNRLHEMNSGQEICKQHPERCIGGTSW